MDEPWCLVASEATVPTPVLIRYYGKRWGIEAGFRDIKDMRFGMGLSSMHVSRPDRRDRLLLIAAPLDYRLIALEPSRSMRSSPQQGGQHELAEMLVVLESR